MVVAVALFVDARLMAALENQPHHVTAFFEVITHVGKSDWVLIPTAILVVVIAFADWSRVSRRHAAAWAEIAAFAATAFLVVAASGLFTDVLKPIFGRMRPPYAEGGVLDFAPLTFGGYRNYSFPSGHSTVSGALLALIAAGPRTGWRMPAMLFVIAVACSRAMINVHYPSDVIAGLVVGSGIGWLILHRMARGGFGFVFRPNGSIGWRFGVVRHMRARGGWISGLMPPLWMALAPPPLLPHKPVESPADASSVPDSDTPPGPVPAGGGEPA